MKQTTGSKISLLSSWNRPRFHAPLRFVALITLTLFSSTELAWADSAFTLRVRNGGEISAGLEQALQEKRVAVEEGTALRPTAPSILPPREGVQRTLWEKISLRPLPRPTPSKLYWLSGIVLALGLFLAPSKAQAAYWYKNASPGSITHLTQIAAPRDASTGAVLYAKSTQGSRLSTIAKAAGVTKAELVAENKFLENSPDHLKAGTMLRIPQPRMERLRRFVKLEDVARLDGKRNAITGRPYRIDQDYFKRNWDSIFKSDAIGWPQETIVVAFQEKYGLRADGDFGPQTLQKLADIERKLRSVLAPQSYRSSSPNGLSGGSPPPPPPPRPAWLEIGLWSILFSTGITLPAYFGAKKLWNWRRERKLKQEWPELYLPGRISVPGEGESHAGLEERRKKVNPTVGKEKLLQRLLDGLIAEGLTPPNSEQQRRAVLQQLDELKKAHGDLRSLNWAILQFEDCLYVQETEPHPVLSFQPPSDASVQTRRDGSSTPHLVSGLPVPKSGRYLGARVGRGLGTWVAKANESVIQGLTAKYIVELLAITFACSFLPLWSVVIAASLIGFFMTSPIVLNVILKLTPAGYREAVRKDGSKQLLSIGSKLLPVALAHIHLSPIAIMSLLVGTLSLWRLTAQRWSRADQAQGDALLLLLSSASEEDRKSLKEPLLALIGAANDQQVTIPNLDGIMRRHQQILENMDDNTRVHIQRLATTLRVAAPLVNHVRPELMAQMLGEGMCEVAWWSLSDEAFDENLKLLSDLTEKANPLIRSAVSPEEFSDLVRRTLQVRQRARYYTFIYSPRESCRIGVRPASEILPDYMPPSEAVSNEVLNGTRGWTRTSPDMEISQERAGRRIQVTRHYLPTVLRQLGDRGIFERGSVVSVSLRGSYPWRLIPTDLDLFIVVKRLPKGVGATHRIRSPWFPVTISVELMAEEELQSSDGEEALNNGHRRSALRLASLWDAPLLAGKDPVPLLPSRPVLEALHENLVDFPAHALDQFIRRLPSEILATGEISHPEESALSPARSGLEGARQDRTVVFTPSAAEQIPGLRDAVEHLKAAGLEDRMIVLPPLRDGELSPLDDLVLQLARRQDEYGPLQVVLYVGVEEDLVAARFAGRLSLLGISSSMRPIGSTLTLIDVIRCMLSDFHISEAEISLIADETIAALNCEQAA